MGYWCTLHLFDDKKFYNEAIPELKGETGDLSKICLEFLTSYVVGGIHHFSIQKINSLIEYHVERIIQISNSFDETFKLHSEFLSLEGYDNKRRYLNELDGYYDFCKFFEYYLFKTSADFFPHLPLGKGGVFRNFTITEKTLSYEIIGELDGWNEFLCGDMMGIRNWITNEEVELLYLDKENLHFDDNKLAEGFLTLLEVANNNKLGFIMGVDMRESTLAILPGNKLTALETWSNKNANGLLWKLF